MSTFNQILYSRIKKKIKSKKRLALEKCPQKRGFCLKVLIKTPKKPNSAKRKVARIHLSNRRAIFAYLPGEQASLKEHHLVLVQGGRTKDLPGLQYKLIRGKYDFMGAFGRKTKRSKYGTTKP